jgi:hypothetical protein
MTSLHARIVEILVDEHPAYQRRRLEEIATRIAAVAEDAGKAEHPDTGALRELRDACEPFLRAWREHTYGRGISAHQWRVLAKALEPPSCPDCPRTIDRAQRAADYTGKYSVTCACGKWHDGVIGSTAPPSPPRQTIREAVDERCSVSYSFGGATFEAPIAPLDQRLSALIDALDERGGQ